MSRTIRITADAIALTAELNDSETAEAVFDALPFEAAGHRWGEEIYFSIPVSAEESPDARAELEVGELAYWPPGSAFCIFFGPTPASHGDEPRAASAVNPLGRILGDATLLSDVPNGATVRIEARGHRGAS